MIAKNPGRRGSFRISSRKVKLARRPAQIRHLQIEAPENRVVLAVDMITEDQKQVLIGGLDALANFGDRVVTTNELSARLPLLS